MKKVCFVSAIKSSEHVNVPLEETVFMHSTAFEEMFGLPKKEFNDPEILAGYVKLSSSKGKAYRKYRAFNTLKGDEAQVDYMALCQLGFPEPTEKVQVEPVSFWDYQWHTMNRYLKCLFILSIGSFVLGILGLFL